MTSNSQNSNLAHSPREFHSPLSSRTMSIISALSLLIASIVFATERRGALVPMELRAYDILTVIRYSRIVPPQPSGVSDYVVFNVDFDEDSVRQYNAFPIPRLLLADVVAKIASGKPSVIGLDVIQIGRASCRERV